MNTQLNSTVERQRQTINKSYKIMYGSLRELQFSLHGFKKELIYFTAENILT